MSTAFDGKRALVTGGTRGIGRAIVERLLAEGARVAFCGRNEAGRAEEELRARGFTQAYQPVAKVPIFRNPASSCQLQWPILRKVLVRTK